MNKTSALALAAGSILFNFASAVDYRFAGVVTEVPAAFSSQFSLGEIASGRMTLTPASFSSTQGSYSVSNFSANIGGNYPITSSGGSFAVLNNFGGSIDVVKLDIPPSLGLAGAPIAGHVPEYFHFNLLYRANEISSTNLLPQFIIGAPTDHSGLRFDGNDSLSVEFDLYDLSMIPEPSSMFLAAASSGIFSMARCRRKRGHQRLAR